MAKPQKSENLDEVTDIDEESDDFEVHDDDTTDYGSDDERRDACEARKLRENAEAEPEPDEEQKPNIKDEEPGNW